MTGRSTSTPPKVSTSPQNWPTPKPVCGIYAVKISKIFGNNTSLDSSIQLVGKLSRKARAALGKRGDFLKPIINVYNKRIYNKKKTPPAPSRI